MHELAWAEDGSHTTLLFGNWMRMIVGAFVKRLKNPLMVKANTKSGSEELNASLMTPNKPDTVINGVKILDEFQNVSDLNFESANVADKGAFP